MSQRVWLACAGIALASWGCGDETLTRLEPKLVVTPEALDFGDGVVDAENVLPLGLANRGAGRLEIAAVDVTEGADVFSVGVFPAILGSQLEDELVVVFVPKAPKVAYSGKLVIRSNDPQNPNIEVPLDGVGGIREIDVIPTEVDFGVVNEGTAPRRGVEIRNLGGDPLVVSGLAYTSTSADLTFLMPDGLPLTVAALTSTTVWLQYAPTDLGADSGTLVITSNDEDEPQVTVRARGRANLAPRALAWICDKRPGDVGCAEDRRARSVSAGVGRLLGLDGRDSADPEGGELEFSWRIEEEPADAHPTLLFGTEDIVQRKRATGEVEVPRVGRYVLRLVAKDDRGLESFDTPESRVAILPKDLEIYLTWDLATDVDLHLVRPGGVVGDYGSGSVGTSTGSDCSTFNRSPAWGAVGQRADDPNLERDVVSARGPEVISLDFPEDGVYTAYAHYCDSRHVNTNVHAWLEVYVRGEAVQRVPIMDGARVLPGELWEAALISWDAATNTAQVSPGTAQVSLRPELCAL
ncbi:MAG: choice-of-anchor D domain-containing protein [Myxococcales bacterium]|nr:choice-of-anchor D domain-containing protein [Myxococcales bacterium]